VRDLPGRLVVAMRRHPGAPTKSIDFPARAVTPDQYRQNAASTLLSVAINT
jgi:hypothetical protein